MKRKDRRRAELGKIHIAAKQLGLDEAAYRAMLRGVASVASARELDAGGRAKVLEHLKACGFRARPSKARSTPADDRAPLIGKIRAQLIAAGNRPDAYADGIARQMFGIERFEWCRPEQLWKIVAALNYDRKRRG